MIGTKKTRTESISSKKTEGKTGPNADSPMPGPPLVEWNMIDGVDNHEVAQKYRLLQFALAETQNHLSIVIRTLYELFPVSPPQEKS